MAASPPIALTDLDRDELLQLLQERPIFGLRPSDLWSARYDVRERRAKTAAEREAKRQAHEAAERAHRRAAAARDRAFDALMAGYDHRREPA